MCAWDSNVKFRAAHGAIAPSILPGNGSLLHADISTASQTFRLSTWNPGCPRVSSSYVVTTPSGAPSACDAWPSWDASLSCGAWPSCEASSSLFCAASSCDASPCVYASWFLRVAWLPLYRQWNPPRTRRRRTQSERLLLQRQLKSYAWSCSSLVADGPSGVQAHPSPS